MAVNHTTNRQITTEYNDNQTMKSSKSRVESLKQEALRPVPDDFDPDEISWVLERVAITDREGGLNAKDLGYYVINVAEEIFSNADIKIPVVPPETGSETNGTRSDVEQVADHIKENLDTSDKNVVVHCYMGMERSVLCVVWYMCKHLGMDLDQAYREVSKSRPIAADRRYWIGL